MLVDVSVNLLGDGFLAGVLAAAVALLTGLGVLLVWAARRARWWGLAVVAGSLAVTLGLGAAVAGVVVNRSFGFYASTSDLLGRAAPLAPVANGSLLPAPAGLVVRTPHWRVTGLQRARRGIGTVIRVQLPGPSSGIVRDGLVYLPSAYFLAPTAALPVIELLAGHPGAPTNYVRDLQVAQVLDREIAARRLPPTLAVMPATYRGRASECVDAVRGDRNETYLTRDVPRDLAAAFPLAPGRSWATLGYSEGGLCAVNLALHSPGRYAAAASLSGYFTAGFDTGTGPDSIYGGSAAAVQRNSPLSWVRSHPQLRSPALYLFSGGADRFSVRADQELAAAARAASPRLPVVLPVLPGGGHNFTTWSVALPAALDYVARYLPRPLAPALLLPTLPPRAAAAAR